MTKKIFILSILLSIFSLQSKATVVYVDVANVSGAENGASWTTAFSKLQSGINAANAGDSVWVAKGEYHTDSFFVMKEGVKIYGGFVNTDIIFYQQDPKNKPVQLNGVRIIYNNQNGLTAAALLDGFILSMASLGAIYNLESSPTISNCTFKINTSNDYGGAIWNANAHPIIKNCYFDNNRAGNGGGAIFNDNSSPNILNCLFSLNQGNYYGKDITNINQSFPYIVNCTFYKSRGDALGVIYNRGGSIPQLYNSIIWGNDTGIYNQDTSNIIIRYCLIQGRTAESGFNNLDGSIDPLLNDLSAIRSLKDNSPCINKGSNILYTDGGGNLQHDLGQDGNPRLAGDIIDLGASEYAGTITGIRNLDNQAQYECIITPNPTKESIHINFTNEKLLHTKAILTDIYGRTVREVILNSKSQQLSLAGLSSGVYVLKTIAGDSVKIVKE